MAYLAKSTVLHAYKLLSGIDSEKQQGLTQKVSALKYASALDLFYKNHGQNCDLKQSANRDEFASLVGDIVKINEDYCTKDFFLSISQNGRDFDCGSNFYSQSSVKDSKTNPNNTFLYPKRSGWKPVMDIQDQVLIYRVDYLNDCFSFYLGSSALRLAYIVWLLRFKKIEEENMKGIRNSLYKLFTQDFCNALYDNSVNFVDTSHVEFDDEMCQLDRDDIHSLFCSDDKQSVEKIGNTVLSHQRIYYGAPGTGKSHIIKDFTQGECVIRTTFHPDSDYSTFVGAYKPTTKKVPMRDVTGKVIKENGKDVTEDHIIYEFVKQSFLKAYVEAWRRYVNMKNDVSTPQKSKSSVISVIPEILSENELVTKMKELMNDGWGYPCQRFGVKYWKSLKGFNRTSRKHLLSLCELSDSMDTELTKGISVGEWLETMMISDHKEFFDNLSIEDKDDNHSVSTNTSVFLIIEEINRGNCAQIFGDLFQLLDRQDNGFSEYPIEADADIQKEIANAFEKGGEYELSEDFNVNYAIHDYCSNHEKEDKSKNTLSEDIKEGRILLLPPNLFIWATMNTSDQSLFPIDSAFKRRWDWQYIPISDGRKGWKIKANGKRYDWWQFLQKINDQIGSTTNSEDKKLGYYFCKAKNGIIDAETFVGKVLFYIWNDVYKDFAEEAGDLFKDEDGGILSFSRFYTVDEDGKTKIVEKKIERLLQNLGIEPFSDTKSKNISEEEQPEE